METIEAGAVKEADTLVVTPSAGDKPIWFTSEIGRTLFQFKSFMMAATNRIMLPLSQEGGIRPWKEITTAVGLGMGVYAFKQAAAGREISDDPTVLAFEAVENTGLAGYAVEMAKKFDAEILLMQSEKPAVAMAASGGPQPDVQSPAAAKVAVQLALDEDKRNLSKAKRYLRRKVREIKAKKIACSYLANIGDPAESIILYARKKKIDLIIMTSHGKSGIVRAIMGSVADEVVRKSGKPVLVIRPNKKSEK